LTEFLPTHKYTKFQNLRIKSASTHTIAIASGYAGRAPQGGTSDGSFLVSSFLSYKEWLKFFFCSLKEMTKINYSQVKKKVVD